jgi:hypothetical protein
MERIEESWVSAKFDFALGAEIINKEGSGIGNLVSRFEHGNLHDYAV